MMERRGLTSVHCGLEKRRRIGEKRGSTARGGGGGEEKE